MNSGKVAQDDLVQFLNQLPEDELLEDEAYSIKNKVLSFNIQSTQMFCNIFLY